MNDATIRGLLPPSSPNADDPAIRPAADSAYREKVEAAAQQFESFFIAQMLRQMRSATRELSAEDSIYRNRINDDMLDVADTAVADALAGQRAFGIADAIVRQMLPPASPNEPAQGFKPGER
ncbi:hypothetical protein [Aromatoleum sp.]|uniref:hypothetical protein n=1 Tax=Aromatoleum sp. TaxID=2307007 RepID=UPI002FCA3190